MDYVSTINDCGVTVPKGVRTALNKFFKKYPTAVEGCTLRTGAHENSKAPVILIIESSTLYHYLQGEYGWGGHTAFHEAFNGSGYYPEMIHSCAVGFYRG